MIVRMEKVELKNKEKRILTFILFFILIIYLIGCYSILKYVSNI